MVPSNREEMQKKRDAREKLRQAGLCRECQRPRDNPRSQWRCVECCARASRGVLACYATFIAEGRCRYCNRRPPTIGTACAQCRERVNRQLAAARKKRKAKK